jgi:AraC family transcriptional regulator of adaptative response/methylated-DNA-[protein]-cysteine methyltransferase
VDPNVALMQNVCRYLEQRDDCIPTLAELSAQFGLSPYHLQRTFKRIVGVSPRQFAQESRLARFKVALKRDVDVTGALYSAGYGSGSSAYEESGDVLGMTPARYRRGGEDQAISYTVTPCPLGWLLVAATGRGLCAVRLGDSAESLVMGLEAEFPSAMLDRDHTVLAEAVAQLSAYLEGQQPHLDLPIDVRATAFQRRVWAALRAIPYGATQSYQQVAQAIERPKAVRAVAGACARNPVALVVPCHRVVRSDGDLGGYRWGTDRKKALLQQEALHVSEAGILDGGPA